MIFNTHGMYCINEDLVKSHGVFTGVDDFYCYKDIVSWSGFQRFCVLAVSACHVSFSPIIWLSFYFLQTLNLNLTETANFKPFIVYNIFN